MLCRSYFSFRCVFGISVLIVLFNSCSSNSGYTIEHQVNPFKIAPLTALLKIKSKESFKASYKVLGETPIEQSFDFLADTINIPVVGLYPGIINKVVVTLTYKNREVIDTVRIETAAIPLSFPKIVIDKLDRSKMEPGLHGCDIHYANYGKFNSIPMIFDDQGIVRWYLDLSFEGRMVSPFQRLSDGTILMVGRHTIYEFNMVGKLLKKTLIDTNYGMHHDVIELPNGNLLICVGRRDAYIYVDGEKILSDSDFVIYFDRKNSSIVKEWDLAQHLDVSRDQLNFYRSGDWLHMNGLAFDPNDSSIIVSGKNQGIVKISWKDDLKWILAPKKYWGKAGRDDKGKSTGSFLLSAQDSLGKKYPSAVQLGEESTGDFDFSWGQHSPSLLPNGNLLVFDNGALRNFGKGNHYSRAVEYKIHENTKTVEQIWQYGMERGPEFYSSIASDADYLPITKNILVTAGFQTPNGIHSAKIVEVDRRTGGEVFEATLFYKTLKGKKTPEWGQIDLLYRSQRMELKY